MVWLGVPVELRVPVGVRVAVRVVVAVAVAGLLGEAAEEGVGGVEALPVEVVEGLKVEWGPPRPNPATAEGLVLVETEGGVDAEAAAVEVGGALGEGIVVQDARAEGLGTGDAEAAAVKLA